MEKITICCLCNGKLTEPIRTLGCLHSACLRCLKDHAAKATSSESEYSPAIFTFWIADSM